MRLSKKISWHSRFWRLKYKIVGLVGSGFLWRTKMIRKLFYYNFSFEDRVRADHPLRKIADLVDFDFAYDAVRDKYGQNGNVSVPPPVILKLMVLLIFYNVRSERELMDTLPERLDWLWFLGLRISFESPCEVLLTCKILPEYNGNVVITLALCALDYLRHCRDPNARLLVFVAMAGRQLKGVCLQVGSVWWYYC